MNFTPIDNNGTVDGFCLIKSLDKKTSSKGDTYLDMTLSDAGGEINAKLWRYNPAVHGEYEINELVKIRGVISQYNGNDQLKIDRIRKITPEDNVKTEDFVKSSDYSGEQMYDELYRIADSFEDEELKAIVTAILADNRLALLYWPAAFKLHHALRGGLLMHFVIDSKAGGGRLQGLPVCGQGAFACGRNFARYCEAFGIYRCRYGNCNRLFKRGQSARSPGNGRYGN